MNRRAAVLAVAGAAVLIGVIGAVRTGLIARPGARDVRAVLVERAIETGQRAFRELDMHPVSAEAGLDAVRACLAAAVVVEHTGPDAARLRAAAGPLVVETAELVYYRFVLASAAEYIDWRKRRGYVLQSGERMAQLSVAQDYPLMFAEPYPGHEQLGRVFERFFDASADLRDAEARVTKPRAGLIEAVCSEGKGVAVAFGEITTATMGAWPRLDAGMTREEWHGLTGGSFRAWWTDPSGGWRSSLERHGRINVAVVGVVVRFRGGSAYPLMANYYEDPATKRWWVCSLGVGNLRIEEIPGVEW